MHLFLLTTVLSFSVNLWLFITSWYLRIVILAVLSLLYVNCFYKVYGYSIVRMVVVVMTVW